MTRNLIDKLFKDASKFQPSKAWPPILNDVEEILFKGGFTTQAWLKKNVYYAIAIFAVCLFALPFVSVSLTNNMILFLAFMVFAGGLLTFFMYRRQEWIITNHAVYVKGRTPTQLSAIKRIQGFGSTVRLTGRFGQSQNLIGVQNASQIRQVLTGREK